MPDIVIWTRWRQQFAPDLPEYARQLIGMSFPEMSETRGRTSKTGLSLPVPLREKHLSKSRLGQQMIHCTEYDSIKTKTNSNKKETEASSKG